MVFPRNVTLAPIGTPLRNLKLEISLVEYVATARCPLINVISSTAASTNFLSAVALPIPWFKQIFVMQGTCILEEYSKRF